MPTTDLPKWPFAEGTFGRAPLTTPARRVRLTRPLTPAGVFPNSK